jgi:hypothetical protein
MCQILAFLINSYCYVCLSSTCYCPCLRSYPLPLFNLPVQRTLSFQYYIMGVDGYLSRYPLPHPLHSFFDPYFLEFDCDGEPPMGWSHYSLDCIQPLIYSSVSTPSFFSPSSCFFSLLTICQWCHFCLYLSTLCTLYQLFFASLPS